MQTEIIEKIKQEQDKLKKLSPKEQELIAFYEDFLKRINFSNPNTYHRVSIEELMIAYVKSLDDLFTLQELKKITDGIGPILRRCSADEVNSLLLLIDDFAQADNYEGIMEILYSENKKIALENLIEEAKGDPDKDYVEPAAKKLVRDKNQKMIEFIEVFHTNPDVWWMALVLVKTFFQMKEDQELNQGYQKFPIIQEDLSKIYDVGKIQKETSSISKRLKTLRKKEVNRRKSNQQEIKKYQDIIDILNKEQGEIKDVYSLIKDLTPNQLRLEIVREIYKRNEAYYEKLKQQYQQEVENTPKGYSYLCEKYNIKYIDIASLMEKYSYQELEKILSTFKDMGIRDTTKAIENTSLERIKEILLLYKQGFLDNNILQKDSNLWNLEVNYPERIKKNHQIAKEILGTNQLLKGKKWIGLIDSNHLHQNLTTLKQYELLDFLSTTENYQFLKQENLKDRIDLILESGKEEELTHNLGLLNYEEIKWKRLQVLEQLEIPVPEESLEGTLHTQHFLVPDEKIEEYITKSPLAEEMKINPEELIETKRTYQYRGVTFSKQKGPSLQEQLQTRKYTPTEITNLKNTYQK